MERGITSIHLYLLVLTLFSVSVLGVDIDSCQTLSSAGVYTLNQSVAATGSCMVISANDVTLDCQGYQISYDTSGGSTSLGINANNRNNVTIKNCRIIDTSATGTTTRAIFFPNMDNSTIYNNTLTAQGTSEVMAIYVLSGASGINITANNLSAISSGTFARPITAISSTNITIQGNTMYSQGSTGDANMNIYIDSVQNMLIENNTLLAHAIGTSDRNGGIRYLNDVRNMRIIGNNIYITATAGSPDDYATGIQGTCGIGVCSNNHFVNNTIVINPIPGIVQFGIGFGTEEYAIIEGNDITLNATTSVARGISLGAVNHTVIRNNHVKLADGTGRGLYFTTGSQNLTFIDNTISGAADWIAFFSNPQSAVFINTTFNESGTPLRIGGPLYVNDSLASYISASDIEVNTTHTYVNTTAQPILNTSGRVYMQDRGFSYYQPLVDYDDNGTFVNCPETLCTIVSQSPTLFVMDVAHFTTFSTAEFIPPVPEFSTWVMLILLGVTMAGFVAMRQKQQ